VAKHSSFDRPVHIPLQPKGSDLQARLTLIGEEWPPVLPTEGKKKPQQVPRLNNQFENREASMSNHELKNCRENSIAEKVSEKGF
jgi:hypothetical protein